MTETVREVLGRGEAPPDPDKLAKRARELRILRALPQDIAAPLVSNVVPSMDRAYQGVAAWLSWSAPCYGADRDTWSGEAIAMALQGAGWRHVPTCLAKFGNYRRSEWPGRLEELPEESRRAPFVDAEPLWPWWVRLSSGGFRSAVATCYAVAPDSPEPVRLSIELRGASSGAAGGMGASVTARRDEYRGGWRYVDPKLLIGEGWHSLLDGAGHVVAMIGSRCFASTYGDPSKHQALDGAVYWEPVAHEYDALPWGLGDTFGFLLRK